MRNDKVYPTARIIAYVIDIIVVSMVSVLITAFIPESDKVGKLNSDLENLSEKVVADEISKENFLKEYSELSYQVDYENVLYVVISTTLTLSYFVVFQYYNKGQTLGKKLMKLKVVSNNDKDLAINQLVYRYLLLGSMLFNILNIAFVLFINSNSYFYVKFPLQIVQNVLILITIFMVLFRKNGRGIHDMLGNTKVVVAD